MYNNFINLYSKGRIEMTDVQIKCFLLLAERLSFTRTAKELSIAQSTLSAHITALERDLDLRLFIRTKRSVFLSPEGEIMRDTFKSISQQMDSGLEVAHNLHKIHSNVIRIGYMQGLNPNIFLNKILDHFRCDYPTVKIEMYRMNNNDLIEGIDNFNLDIAITFERVISSRPDLDSKFVYKTPVSITLSNNKLKEKGGELKIKDLQNEKFIVLSSNVDSTEREFLQNIFKKINLNLETILEVSSVESQFMKVDLGEGVALCNHTAYIYGNPKFSFLDIPDMTTKVIAISKRKQPNQLIPNFQKYFKYSE